MLALGCSIFMLRSVQHGSTPVVWDLKRNKHPEPYFNKAVVEVERAVTAFLLRVPLLLLYSVIMIT